MLALSNMTGLKNLVCLLTVFRCWNICRCVRVCRCVRLCRCVSGHCTYWLWRYNLAEKLSINWKGFNHQLSELQPSMPLSHTPHVWTLWPPSHTVTLPHVIRHSATRHTSGHCGLPLTQPHCHMSYDTQPHATRLGIVASLSHSQIINY